MRQTSGLIAASLLVVSFLVSAGAASARTLIRLSADHLAFYYDRFLIEADGHVRVTTSDGTTITGDAFSMDLKLNRFLVASHVHLRSPGGAIDGAAIADFLDFNRVYFVPVISKPDRWTYLNGDYKTPLKGREMPGDVFYFPDVSASTVSLTAKTATIGAKSFVRFAGVTTSTFHAQAPLPSFYVYFGTNQDLAVNSLSGANFDITWNAFGNDNAITAVHARYDTANKEYLSLEQHFAGAHEYAAISVNPGTEQQHYWNMVAADHMGSRFQLNTFSQFYVDQRFFRQPSAASLVNYVTATQAFKQSYLQAAATFVNYNLANGPAILNHPTGLQLTASTFSHRIAKTPFYEQLRYSFGFNHDSYGSALQTYGGTTYTTIWNHALGYTFYLPSFKFGNRDNAYKTYYFNGSIDAQRLWYSVPHHINSTNANVSISRQFSRDFNTYVSYAVGNTSDIYNHGGYSPCNPGPPTNPNPNCPLSFTAFRGASTARIATLGMNYSANPNLYVGLTLQHRDDFPIAVPGLFALPPINNIGQFAYSNYLGSPPNSIAAEVRARLLPHLVIDVQRTYFFNYGTLRWSPQFVVQFSQ